MQKKPSMAALIDILKENKETPKVHDWEELEEHIQRVYQILINLKGDNTVVARNVFISGRDGAAYQIDVYYEFTLAGIQHRVAIECKNSKRPVERNDVIAFKGKIDDCLGVMGVIIATNGFQEGAKKYANDNGIINLTLDELPSLGGLLGIRLEDIVFPSECIVGQPFWTLYEIETFAPLGHEMNGKSYALLFYSKVQAEKYLTQRNLASQWCVRGLARKHLASLILVVDSMNGKYGIVLPEHISSNIVFNNSTSTNDFIFMPITRFDLIKFYYDGSPLPNEPLVMPGLK